MSSSEYPHIVQAERYVDDVLSGRKFACKWIRLACERYRRDVTRIPDSDWPYTFDADKAEHAIRFMTRFKHVKGKWAREHQLFLPEDWQCFFYANIFGWVRKSDGNRRFRRVRLYVPRKNGKSLMVAPLGLYMLAADGEPGAEVYSGATSEKQAWEVFGPAKKMAEDKIEFRQRFGVQINAKSLTIGGTLSKFEPLIGKPGDGASPHCSITDEFHEHATDDQIATMETGMGARSQPFSVVVSTAGDNLAGPCRDDWLTCENVLKGVFDDEELFAMIYTVDDPENWTTEDALVMANPNFGVSKDAESLRSEQRQAIQNPRKQGHFKTKHLNVWVQARDAYFNIEQWRRCKDERLKLDDFKGHDCILAMDLASKIDLCALELLFPTGYAPDQKGKLRERYVRFGKYYLPRERVDMPENKHYQGWEKQGLLTVTEGNMTDYFVILEDIKSLGKVFTIRELAYDPHNATMLIAALQHETSISLVEFGPTVLNFSEPMKELDGLIRDGRIAHDGDPIQEWSLSNVVAKPDRKDNVYPTKERDENKIDPSVSLIMAVGRALVGMEPADDFSGFLADPVVA